LAAGAGKARRAQSRRSPVQVAAKPERPAQSARQRRKPFAAAVRSRRCSSRSLGGDPKTLRGIGTTRCRCACDVTDAKTSVQAAFDQIAAAFGGVDCVVSNAGAAGPGPHRRSRRRHLRKSFELNFYGHQRVRRQRSGS